MSYSEEEKKNILGKVLKITIAEATRMKEDFAPDILVEPILAKYIGGIDREAAFREFSKML